MARYRAEDSARKEVKYFKSINKLYAGDADKQRTFYKALVYQIQRRNQSEETTNPFSTLDNELYTLDGTIIGKIVEPDIDWLRPDVFEAMRVFRPESYSADIESVIIGSLVWVYFTQPEEFLGGVWVSVADREEEVSLNRFSDKLNRYNASFESAPERYLLAFNSGSNAK